MKMIDVKLPKPKVEEVIKQPVSPERDRWPYGLKITFESEQVDKLPQLAKASIGENLTIEGVGEVMSIRMNEEKEGKKRYSVEVQIQHIGVETSAGISDTMGKAMNKVEKSRTLKMNEG